MEVADGQGRWSQNGARAAPVPALPFQFALQLLLRSPRRSACQSARGDPPSGTSLKAMNSAPSIDVRNRAESLVAAFVHAGYDRVTPAILQPAEPFFDLSGEDMRRHMYLVTDTAGREFCLRPDITIPVARDYLDVLEQTNTVRPQESKERPAGLPLSYRSACPSAVSRCATPITFHNDPHPSVSTFLSVSKHFLSL